MRRWGFVAAGLLMVGLTWNWLQGADVPDGTINADHYAAGATAVGANVLSDLQALETAVNDIDSSNVSATANIQGTKLLTNSVPYNKIITGDIDVDGASWLFGNDALEDTILARIIDDDGIDNAVVDACFHRGVLQTVEAGAQHCGWGDTWLYYTNPQAAYDLTDTLLPDSGWVFMIDFADSSDCGDPGLAAAPTYVNISQPYEAATPTPFHVGDYDNQRRTIGDLTFSIVFLSADSCSVYAHNPSSDTLAVSGYKIFWEVKE